MLHEVSHISHSYSRNQKADCRSSWSTGGEGDSTRFGLASAAVHSYPPAVQTHVLGLYVYVDKDSFRPHYLNWPFLQCVSSIQCTKSISTKTVLFLFVWWDNMTRVLRSNSNGMATQKQEHTPRRRRRRGGNILTMIHRRASQFSKTTDEQE